jgi:hypothetical protein
MAAAVMGQQIAPGAHLSGWRPSVNPDGEVAVARPPQLVPMGHSGAPSRKGRWL